MKKSLFLLLIASLLTGCKSNEKKEEDFHIISPTGAPALAFYNFLDSEYFETNSDPSNIIPLMVGEKVDIAVLPTNAGFQAIKGKHVNYKCAATITFGNIYIGATGNDDDGVMDSDDYIVSFQKGAVPDKIFHYIYGDVYDNALHYVSNAQEAAKCLKAGKNLAEENETVDYVVLAEPALTNVISTTPGRSIYANLQELYKVKSNNLSIFQASIFVKNGLNRDKIEQFLNTIKTDIEFILKHPDEILEFLKSIPDVNVLLGINPATIGSVLKENRLGLGFAIAKDNKNSIDLFLSLFGIGATNEEDYF